MQGVRVQSPSVPPQVRRPLRRPPPQGHRLRNLPFDLWRRNAVWLELVLAACDLTCWAQALLPDGALARAEPKALRYRLWHTAARVVRHARRLILRLQRTSPWSAALARAFVQCELYTCAADRPGPSSRARPAAAGLPWRARGTG